MSRRVASGFERCPEWHLTGQISPNHLNSSHFQNQTGRDQKIFNPQLRMAYKSADQLGFRRFRGEGVDFLKFGYINN